MSLEGISTQPFIDSAFLHIETNPPMRPPKTRRTFFRRTNPTTTRLLSLATFAGIDGISVDINGEVVLTQWIDTPSVAKGAALQKPSVAKPQYPYEDQTPKGKPATELAPKVFTQGAEMAQRGLDYALASETAELGKVLALKEMAYQLKRSVESIPGHPGFNLLPFQQQVQALLADQRLMSARDHEKRAIAAQLQTLGQNPHFLGNAQKVISTYRKTVRLEIAAESGVRKYAQSSRLFAYQRHSARLAMADEFSVLHDLLERPALADPNFKTNADEDKIDWKKAARDIWKQLALSSFRLVTRTRKVRPYANRAYREMTNWGTVNLGKSTPHFRSIVDTGTGEELCIRTRQWQTRQERDIPTATYFLALGDFASAREIIEASCATFYRLLATHQDVQLVRPSFIVDQKPSDKRVPQWVKNIIEAGRRSDLSSYDPKECKGKANRDKWLKERGLFEISFPKQP